MRAIAIREFGGRDRLELMDVPEPKVAPDGVLIRIHAASANPVDWKVREGRMEPSYPHLFPVVMGWDASGVVERVGAAVTTFRRGDEVFAYCRKHFIGEGTYAELVSVPESFVATKPNSLDFSEAAALPLAGLTAYQSLVGALQLRSGETVLVHAAAGGVGTYAVQIASGLGARVLGTAGPDNRDYVRGLGADEVIDYRSEDVVQRVLELVPGGVDALFDLVGGDTLNASVDLVRDGGRIVSLVEREFDDQVRQRGIEPRYVFVRPNGEQLAELARMTDDGGLRVHLQELIPLEQAARAHELLEEGHVRGKLALDVSG